MDQRGIKDASLFLSALENPKQTFNGNDLYPDIMTKAAAYLRSFALNHSFHNGNKRTALMAAILFLEQNGYEVIGTKNRLLRMAKSIVIYKPSVEKIKQKYLKKVVRYTGERSHPKAYIEEYKNPIIKWISKVNKTGRLW